MFRNGSQFVEEFLRKGIGVGKEKSPADLEMDPEWMLTDSAIARRCRDDKDFGLKLYLYDRGPILSAFADGFLEHRYWLLRRNIEKNKSRPPLFDQEANYTNTTGY